MLVHPISVVRVEESLPVLERRNHDCTSRGHFHETRGQPCEQALHSVLTVNLFYYRPSSTAAARFICEQSKRW